MLCPGSIDSAFDHARRTTTFLAAWSSENAPAANHDEQFGFSFVSGPEFAALDVDDLRQFGDATIGVVVDGLERSATATALRKDGSPPRPYGEWLGTKQFAAAIRFAVAARLVPSRNRGAT